MATTALTWVAFERRELTGLAAALERLPAQQRVLGLDYEQRSPLVRGRPFLQTYAWAQVLRGGTLNFSFASFPTSLVVFRSSQPSPGRRSSTGFRAICDRGISTTLII